jgi:hypothetical protein
MSLKLTLNNNQSINNIGTLSENIVSFSAVFPGECKGIIYFPTLYIVFILQCQKAQDNCQIVQKHKLITYSSVFGIVRLLSGLAFGVN